MLIAALTPAAEAAVFTLGCALIQAQRHHAEQLTHVLTVVALAALLSIVFLITPADQLNIATEATAMADTGSSLLLQPE